MSKTLRKLTFVTDAPHFGGAERYLLDMAQAAERRGMNTHIHWLPLSEGDEDVFSPERTGSTRITTIPSSESQSSWGMCRALNRMIQREKPDGLIINAAGRRRFWLTAWCAYAANLPCVWVHHMVEGDDHRRLQPHWLGGRVEGMQWWRMPQTIRHRLASWAATHVITSSSADQERINRWQRVPLEKIRVVQPGVDCERFKFDSEQRRALRQKWLGSTAQENTTFIVGTAGRLVAGKRVDLLIDAVAQLRQQNIPCTAVIAGQGPERQPLEQRAHHRGLDEAVHFLEFVEDMPAFHSALDTFALCSTTESFGLVITEALACSRPVIATPTTGATQQITNEHNGLLLPNDEPGQLVSALMRLYRDPNIRDAMGRAGRMDVVDHFNIDLTLERTLSALNRSTHTPSRASSLSWPGMNDTTFQTMATEDAA